MPNKLFIASMACLIIFASCSSPRYIHSSNHPNNPFFSEKGDSKIAAYYSGGGSRGNNEGFAKYNNGVDLQAAYAIADNWSLTASYYNRKERDSYLPGEIDIFDESSVRYYRRLLEIGGGYFIATGPKKTVHVSLYAGTGLGRTKWSDEGFTNSQSFYSRNYETRIRKIFFQPSIQFAPGNFKLSLTQRFSFLHFGDVVTNYTTEEQDYFELPAVEDKTKFFAETSLLLHLNIPGLEWAAIETGMTLASQPNKIDYNRLRSRGLNASIGLSFDFFKIKK